MSNSPNNSHSEEADPVDNIKNQARQTASQVRDSAADAFRDIKQRGEAVAGDIKHKADDLKHELEVYVRNNPTKSVLIAAGAGFVMGLLLRR